MREWSAVHGLPANVFYDPASSYSWAELNETEFLKRVFLQLQAAMAEDFRNYEFHVLSSHDPRVRPDSLSPPSRRKVLVFISDEAGEEAAELASHYFAIFKSYLPRELPGTNVFPFNIGYVDGVPTFPVKPVTERPISVFFSGSLSGNRVELYRAVHPVYRRLPSVVLDRALALSLRGVGRRLVRRDLSGALPGAVLRFTSGFKEGMPPAEYGRSLADSRIVLCPMGGKSNETFRHMEAFRAGAVVVSQPLPDVHFYRGAPIATVGDWRSGLARAQELLADETGLAALQQESLSWWENVCSEAATARFMRDCLHGLLPA